MSETKTITGICAEVSERGEWTTFAIDGGGQYPVKLSTKLQPLIELGRATKGQLATWTYSESDGAINPNSGKPYKNRWLEKVEIGGAQDAPDATERPAPPALGADKDRLIVRQTCIKVAAGLFQGYGVSLTDPETEDAVQLTIKAATRFERWVVTGILDPIPFE